MPLSTGGVKQRPALLIATLPPYGDRLPCGITSSLGVEVKDFDVLLDKAHPDFAASGLAYTGLIRIGFLSTVPLERIEAVIGQVSPTTLRLIVERIKSRLPE
jgi:hypothetical protein